MKETPDLAAPITIRSWRQPEKYRYGISGAIDLRADDCCGRSARSLRAFLCFKKSDTYEEHGEAESALCHIIAVRF